MIFSLDPVESTAKSNWGYTVLLPFSALKEAWVINHDWYLFLRFGIVLLSLHWQVVQVQVNFYSIDLFYIVMCNNGEVCTLKTE